MLMKLVDSILFVFFLVVAIAALLIDSQTVLPSHFFPTILTDYKSNCATQYGDYLIIEKPHFFVGIVWVELLTVPLALASLYAIIAGKSWLPTTCLIYGATGSTAMVTILSDMIGSGKAPEKLLMTCYPLLGLSILAILRGLVPHSNNTNQMGRKTGIEQEKEGLKFLKSGHRNQDSVFSR